MNIYNTKIKLSFLLDLFDAGYKSAYLSSMEFISSQKNFYNRIEMFLPNVGRLCLYQTFIDILDEQVPNFTVFYSAANKPNTKTQIKDVNLLKRATYITYKTKKYFENHPEHACTYDDLIKIIKSNQNMMQKQYEK